MQFHLNGFRLGDPRVQQPLVSAAAPVGDHDLPECVDVLIVGCGPAGLTLAAQLAAFPEIKTVIIDEKAGPLRVGQADGIACRTMEMFEAFGFSERVLKESYWVNETSFWKPSDTERNAIVRQGKIQDTETGLSEFPHVILNQARIHDFYLDVMSQSASRLTPRYSRRLAGLTRASDQTAEHPLTVSLSCQEDPAEERIETIHARFVVGCDGARSEVRKSLGRSLKGDSANQAWGVMDVLAVTDFPDIRLKATIHSAEEGSVLVIPREGGFLVRLYIELDKLNANERVSRRNITADHLIAAAKRILNPYTLEVKEVAWWSVYEIGQRLCDSFDDAEDDAPTHPRVFIAGDACHTHSPKAGQGMNVSMQDSFNLGWKLGSVIAGRSSPKILDTYSQERRAIAQELIDFDREFAKMFSARPVDPADPEGPGVDPKAFQTYFVRQGRFTAGVATQYRPSVITAEPLNQPLALGFKVGARFHSAPVVRLADARPMQLGHTIRADGRWRLFAFAPAKNPVGPESVIESLCAFLSGSPSSPVRKYTPRSGDIDAVIDVRAVFQQDHRALSVEDLPDLLLPLKGRYGLRDYEKAFCAGGGEHDIFALREINRLKGCIVVVRPDQHVAAVLPLDAHEELAAFFDGFMLVPATDL